VATEPELRLAETASAAEPKLRLAGKPGGDEPELRLAETASAAEPKLRLADKPGAGDRVVLVLRDAVAAGQPLACRLQVVLGGRAAEAMQHADLPYPGDGVVLTGMRLRLPAQAIHADLFDYRAFLRTQRIGAVASTWGADQAHFLGPAPGAWAARLERPILAWRRATVARLDASLSRGSAGLVRAMLLGDTSGLDRATRQTFARIGCAHLFAVAGVHTGLLVLLVFLVCRICFVPPRLAAWITLALLSAFLVVVGFKAPVVRASVLAFCAALPFLARRRVDPLGALALGALVTALADPLAPFRCDYQLSYLCVFGLLVLHKPVAEWLRVDLEVHPPRSWLLRLVLTYYNLWIATGLAVVIATQAMVAPLLAVYFGQVSLTGLLANLVLVPLSGILLGFGWAFALIGSIAPGTDALLGDAFDGLSRVFLAIARFFDVPGLAALHEPAFPWWLIVAYYALLLSGRHLLEWRWPGGSEVRRAQVLLRLAAVLAILVWWPLLSRLPLVERLGGGDAIEVAMLDVGQGNCFLVREEADRAVLYDAGPPARAEAVLDYLRAEGIETLDALVLSHGDADHSGGAPDLLAGLPVQHLVVAQGAVGSPSLDQALAVAEREAIPVERVARGDRMALAPGAQLTVLSPPSASGPAAESVPMSESNERSLVLRLDFAGRRVLFMGDAPVATETELLRTFDVRDLRADALQVGHHGSSGSSSPAFLRAVAPSVALVSVGLDNSYGHPSPEVLRRLRDVGARTVSTAEEGTTEVWLTPSGVETRTLRAAPQR
jgi:competence protein ComEC